MYFLMLVSLLVWAIPFPILIQLPKFGVYEDAIMLLTGLYAVAMLVVNWEGLRASLPREASNRASTR
jgi:hypothetical protein